MNELSSIEYLLRKVNKAFGVDEKPNSFTYIYHIGMIRGDFVFTVVDEWHRWLDKHYQVDFRGATPQDAIQGFLQYIEHNNINPAKLRSE